MVEFRLHGDRRLAVVDRPEGKKHLQVIDENGTPHILHPRQIDFVITSSTESPRFTVKQIQTFFQQVQEFLDPSSLEVAWEILSADVQSTTPEDLASLLFSDVRPATIYAAYWLLSDDKLYFKQKGQVYEPRPASQVADLKHQNQLAQARAQEVANFVKKMQDRVNGVTVEWTASDRTRLESLERFAIHGDEASDKSTAFEYLSALKRTRSEGSAFQLLVDLGIWTIHENLNLLRSQVPTKFPADVLNHTKACIENPKPDPMHRLDLTHLHVYTIDDESTTEIDDGLSIETLPNGKQRLWIHIADPTRWMEPNDILDREARKRGTTIYLPTGMIPMFPPALATGEMSLVQRQICHALSFAVELSDQGEVEYYEIHASLIKPSYRLTYEDVQEMLALGVEADLEAIAHHARLRASWRLNQGAININLPEAIIKANPHDNDQLDIEVIDNSFARKLVAEMMILTGEVAAKYAQTHNIPVPYRFQGQPELPTEETLQTLPPGPVREFAMVRCMQKGEVGVIPSRHAGLGLDAYVQVTSPIRRYGDLLIHFQIKAHVAGLPLPFTESALQDLLSMIDPAIYEASQMEKQTVRYWSLEYLRRHRDHVWRAVLLDWLKEQDRIGLILLEDIGLKIPIKLNRAVNVGENLNLKVSDVDPRRDIIQFQEATMATISDL
ncbi:exoribonuclease R [Synechococcus sp. PCC 7502]|nr:exoribonuclease R [Synechococcus sp. PCC 7502]